MFIGVKRKWKWQGTCLLLVGLLLFGSGSFSMAAETKEQVLMEIKNDAQVYEAASKDSAIVASLPKGTAVICAETDSEQWYQVIYQDVNGFVLAEALGLYGDVEALDREFEEIQEDDSYQFEAIEEKQQQKRSQLLWGGIMAVLVVLMFATGLYAVLRNKRKGTGKGQEKGNHH